ncbi:MAG: hypothetical protein J1F35_01775 [Erysipelotrichales bacterium]|nr:hypothetical protein [Erysipelotrichales bacterium]
MDNLVSETNSRIQEIIDSLTTIKNEYEKKLRHSSREINNELEKVKKYKADFFIAKQKIEKMNADIEGFEQDYQNLVDRFKDDELANILIAANKEISAKVTERKRKIAKDKIAMNGLIEKAELSKNKLVKLTAEKKALELCLVKILDSYEFYTRALSQVITYSLENEDNLSQCFFDKDEDAKDSIAKAINEISSSAKSFVEETPEDDKDDDYSIEDDEVSDEDVVIEENNFEEVIDKIAEEVVDEDEITEEAPEEEVLDISDVEETFDEVNEDEGKEEENNIEISDEINEEDENNTDKLENTLDLENIFKFDDSIES